MTQEDRLRVGAGRADITPEMGIQIAGDIGRVRPVEEIRNPLYARALVMESEGKRACFIATDATTVMRKWSTQIRQRVADMLGTTPDAVMVHGSQSHSSVSVGNHIVSDDFDLVPEDLPWLRGGDERYIPTFMKGVMEAVEQAKAGIQPAAMKAVRGMDGRVAFNRRFILRDGTAQTHPGRCNPEVLCCEGPTDPEASIVIFESASGKPIAALLHHTCHPVHGYPKRYICPDWPGLWAEEVRKMLGGDCVAMTANGACGNIHESQHLNPNYKHEVGPFVACLVETVERILPDAAPVHGTPVAWASRTLQLPMRKLPPDEVAAARKLLKENPGPMWTSEKKDNIHWDWVYALATLDLARQQEKQSWYDYEIQVFRAGGLALVGWPGEPFVEAQLKLKTNSIAEFLFVAHMANDSAGYQPTREAFKRGGYETRTANWSKLDESALDRVVAETKALLRDIFAS